MLGNSLDEVPYLRVSVAVQFWKAIEIVQILSFADFLETEADYAIARQRHLQSNCRARI
jgi:hypothetical protein